MATAVKSGPGQVGPGPWDPPRKQPIRLYIGNRAHALIARHYVDANPNDRIMVNTTPIATIVQWLAKRGVGASLNQHARAVGALALRPDIVNLTTLEVYEIKPAGLIAQARAVLDTYLAAFHDVQVPMTAGRSNAPGTIGVVPAPAGHFRFWSPEPGIIVYRYHPGAYAPATQPAPDEQADKQADKQAEGQTVVAADRDPALVPAQPKEYARRPDGFWARMSEATGLTGRALQLYVILSLATRAIPARNLAPAP